MRQLSPREIRLTSPRALTPRMAAKIATAHLQSLPVPPSSRPSKTASSPVVIGFANSASDTALTPSAWPAIPFAKMNETPSSPSSMQEYFPKFEPQNMSAETVERIDSEVPAKPAASDLKPRRPARPPSPKLEHARTLSHSLSPEMVDQLRSPQGSPSSPPEETDGRPRQRGRANSISLKGLRHQLSAKNINSRWRNEKDRPELPPRVASETLGLFKSNVEPNNSSFASLRAEPSSSKATASMTATTTAEFKDVGPSIPTTPNSAPVRTKTSQNGFASRILHGSFSFSRKISESGQGQASKRSPSISSPVADTFQKVNQSPVSQQARTPTSPVSPRSVKRKPVPGGKGLRMEMPASESMTSMRSFVLEDPPKKRVPQGAAF